MVMLWRPGEAQFTPIQRIDSAQASTHVFAEVYRRRWGHKRPAVEVVCLHCGRTEDELRAREDRHGTGDVRGKPDDRVDEVGVHPAAPRRTGPAGRAAQPEHRAGDRPESAAP